MIPAYHDRRLQFPAANHPVKFQSRFFSFSQAQPADTGGQPLKGDPFPGLGEPGFQAFVFREKLQQGAVGFVDIFRVTAKRYPAEGAFALAEERPDIGR
ncbi:hypothetical protein D9M70_563410 [compost metagenome]